MKRYDLIVLLGLIIIVVYHRMLLQEGHVYKEDSAENVVNLGYARYRGIAVEAGVKQFLGMRYAAPPTGDRRWRLPEDPEKHTTTQDAAKFGAICVGQSQSVSQKIGEDCLFINVFTPSNASSASRLPVWVYIQGGGYATNSNFDYNGTAVVVKSHFRLIFVNFNYRVGALGFLASEKIRRNGLLNAGLHDQRKALEWFGGDPEHVVIHGASAGAGSVAYHLTAYGGRDDGLFVGAILQSPFFPTHRTVEQSEFQFDRFLADTGCKGAWDEMACLRSLDIDALQAANVASPFPGSRYSPNWSFLPCIDGEFSSEYLYSAFERGKYIMIPVMVGGDTDEGSLFAPNASTPQQIATFFQNNYPQMEKADMDEIQSAYPLMPSVPFHAAFFPSASAAYGDAAFTCPGLFVSMAMSRHLSGRNIWNYRYNVQDPNTMALGLGVTHTAETPAIFGVGYAGGLGSSLEDADAAIVPIVMAYYISFVKALDPNIEKSDEAPYWDGFHGGGQRRLKLQTNVTAMEEITREVSKRCKMWQLLHPRMQQ